MRRTFLEDNIYISEINYVKKDELNIAYYDMNIKLRLKKEFESKYYNLFFKYNKDEIYRTINILFKMDETERIKKVLKKYDVYMFGHVMNYLLYKIKKKGIEYKKFEELKECVKNMILFDIERRYDNEKALEEMEKL